MQCTVSQFLIIQCKRSLLSLFPITLFSNYAYPICVRVFIFISKILKLNMYFMRILVRMWFIWRKARQSLSFFFWLKKEKEKRNSFLNWVSILLADELSIEKDAERKIGWLLKLIFAGTASAVAYQLFPYLGLSIGLIHNLVMAYLVKIYYLCSSRLTRLL